MKKKSVCSENSKLYLSEISTSQLQYQRKKKITVHYFLINPHRGCSTEQIEVGEPGVHEASLRRYGSELVYNITVYFFIYISYSYLQIQYIDTINVPFCILQQ